VGRGRPRRAAAPGGAARHPLGLLERAQEVVPFSVSR
jgi:hypothetical protein